MDVGLPFLFALAFVIPLVGCNTIRDVQRDVARSESNIPAVDVNVEVQEAPGLFQVTK